MIKKNPSYRLTVYPSPVTKEQPFIIEYPITCRFNSIRGTFSQANKCTIELYNLAPSTQIKIFKDALVGDLTEKNWKFVKLEAGWNGVLSQVFYGRILQAYTSKTGGQTDVITRIECLPFDIFSSQSSYTFAAGTSYKEAYKTMAADLPNCEIGNIGTLEGTFKTQTTFEGSTLECLNQLSGGNTYIDNGVLNTLMSNEVIQVPVPLVTDSNGLLSTPIRRNATLTIKMLFEPTLIVGQLLEVRSKIQSQYDGQYKVLGFTHDCVISPTQAGQRITTVELWAIPDLTNTDINITDEQITGAASSVNAYMVNKEEVTPITEKEPTGVREVYNFIQKNNGKIPDTKITNNITWKEMLGNDNSSAERKSECTLAVLTNCYYTAQKFQKIINTYYQGVKVKINSGWRSRRNNNNCGGKPTSKHLSGLAIDFTIPGQNTYSVYSKFKQIWHGWVGYYKSGNFIHAQIDSTKGISNDR